MTHFMDHPNYSPVSACTSASSVARAALVQKASAVRPYAVLGLPRMRNDGGRVRCSVEAKAEESKAKVGMGASLMAAAASPAAMGLVDERMITEGAGLPFGVSNNLLGWIIFGVFGLIWTLYFVYEDEESGLSL